MDRPDSIAESVAEAGNPGYSLIHPGHGALEFGLSAEEDIGLSLSSLPSSLQDLHAGSHAEDTSVSKALQGLVQRTHLSCYMSREVGCYVSSKGETEATRRGRTLADTAGQSQS